MSENETSDRTRPTVLRWLAYAFGAGLPAANRTWVLHDTTCSTWYLRHLARALVQLAIPIVVLSVLLPEAAWIRSVTVGAATLLGLIFSVAFMVETTENRLVKAGYPVGLGEQIRQQQAIRAQQVSSARRRERIAARAAAR